MSGALWTLTAMQSAMNARLIEPIGKVQQPDIGGISIDTRTLQTGDAYFAIKGDVHDGHKFVGAAISAGAAIAVVSEEKLSDLGTVSAHLLVVDDVLGALVLLGQAARARSTAKIIAVTGSVGKTTTKEALRHVLTESGRVHASAASYNNHWGVPLTLARMPQDTDFGIFEIGMNHPGEITPLVAMVKPHAVMITTIAAAHLGAFKDLAEIADAKAEIFSGLQAGGTAVLNRDNDYFDQLAGLAVAAGVNNVISFGEHQEADARLMKVKLHARCSCITACIAGEKLVAKIGAPGRHMVQNALGVLAVVESVGADLAKAALSLGSLNSVKGRGERHELALASGPLTLIDESYNANPASMGAALDVLFQTQPGHRGRRIAVLGDMLELGSTSSQLHTALAGPIESAKVDMLFLAGNDMQALQNVISGNIECTYAETADALIESLLPQLRGNDVVMVKSSLGLRFGKIVEAILATHPALSGVKEANDSAVGS